MGRCAGPSTRSSPLSRRTRTRSCPRACPSLRSLRSATALTPSPSPHSTRTRILTDRLSRNIIQDLVELETAVKLKDGVDRSPKRVASTQKRFTSAIDNLDKFLAYFK